MGDDATAPPERGDTYHHGQEHVEIVFERADGRVLTISEYATVAAFREAVGDARYEGTHDGVRDLPPVEAFEPDE